MIPTMQAVTITVSSLQKAKQFYEETLGFEADSYYEQGRWQCYKSEGRAFLGITEVSDMAPPPAGNIINFDVDDLPSFWDRVKDRVQIEFALGRTEWGSTKFVIVDPDGNRLGFLERRR